MEESKREARALLDVIDLTRDEEEAMPALAARLGRLEKLEDLLEELVLADTKQCSQPVLSPALRSLCAQLWTEKKKSGCPEGQVRGFLLATSEMPQCLEISHLKDMLLEGRLRTGLVDAPLFDRNAGRSYTVSAEDRRSIDELRLSPDEENQQLANLVEPIQGALLEQSDSEDHLQYLLRRLHMWLRGNSHRRLTREDLDLIQILAEEFERTKRRTRSSFNPDQFRRWMRFGTSATEVQPV